MEEIERLEVLIEQSKSKKDKAGYRKRLVELIGLNDSYWEGEDDDIESQEDDELEQAWKAQYDIISSSSHLDSNASLDEPANDYDDFRDLL